MPNLGLQSDLPGTMLHELFHAFGLTANISATAPAEYYFDLNEATDYTLQLHDLSHRSLKELMDNDQGYWARSEDGSRWLYGVASDQTWGIGLHIYGSENIVRQTADLLANGAYGIGARIEGVGNNLTIASGTQIEANGYAGKGLLFSWGKNHHLTIEEDASVTAAGEGGIAVAFDFGSNELGDWYGYYGSYISTRYDSDAEDFVSSDFIVPELQGELISRFTVSGALKGSTASIYISPNAYVKDIVIEPGATIEGDIISLWNPEQTLYGTQLSGYDGDAPLITTLSFGTENSQSTSETIEFNDRIVGQKKHFDEGFGCSS